MFSWNKILQSIWEEMRSVSIRCNRESLLLLTGLRLMAVLLASPLKLTYSSELVTNVSCPQALVTARRLRRRPWSTKLSATMPWQKSLLNRTSVELHKALLSPTSKHNRLQLDSVLTSTTSLLLLASRVQVPLKCYLGKEKEVLTLTPQTCYRLKAGTRQVAKHLR